MLKKIVIGAVLAGILSVPGFTKTPPEVLSAFKAHNVAVKAGDKKKALKYSKVAWEKAEALMGDHKTTGDLALVYARLEQNQDTEKAIKAYARSINLAPEGSKDQAIAKIERYVDIIQAIVITEDFKRARKYIRDGEVLVKENDLTGTTFDGEILALSGLLSYASGRDKIALKKYDQAVAIFESEGHSYQSIFPYLVRLYKGNLLKLDVPIKAALEYQVVMQNLEGVVTKDHPMVSSAFGKWLNMMSDINRTNKLEEAEAAGVCKCWPYDEMRSNRAIPIKRVPPVMPRSARQSGHVNFRFDLDDAGKVVNHEVINSTQDRYVKPALKSLQQWEYEPIQDGDDPATRRGLVTKISFRIVGRNGKIIPEPSEKR